MSTAATVTLADLFAAARDRGIPRYRTLSRAELEAALAGPAERGTPVRLERDGPLAVIVLDDHDARNALGEAAFDALDAIVAGLERDPDVRLVAITGDGTAFCAGARIADYDGLPDGGERLTARGTAVLDRLAALPVPVVALLNGHAVGGGAELALACDMRLAAPEAELRLVHTGIGLVPGWGGAVRLARLVGDAAAFRLIALRARLRADQAQRLGLVDDVVPADALRERARALAAHVAEGDRDAIARMKALLTSPLDARPALASAAFVESWPARRVGPPAPRR